MERDSMQVQPETHSWQVMYKLMIGSIVPRPIGWISTVDAAGTPNLAPYSFFNAVCPNPPHVLFCPNVRPDAGHKDTLANVRATGEFVVNLVSEMVAEAMNVTSGEYMPTIDEFVIAGLTPISSVHIKPPRVAESPIQFECVVTQIVDVSSQPGGGSVVIGRVLCMHIDDGVLLGDDKIDLDRFRPIGRLAGNSYARVTDRFDMARPVVTQK
jgi:flavin reductase (DIM6/NTAB) family NADH-FMN oxidoreductase RutF